MPYIPTVFLGEKIIGGVSSDPRSLSACLLIRITHIISCEIFQPHTNKKGLLLAR